jgi:hypothetical protein
MITLGRARRLTKCAISGGFALAIVVASATPAAADPPRPTNYESVITSVTPAVNGLEAQVVGGDSFMSLRVHDAAEVVVLGYEGEPYLRFGVNEIVEENIYSPAVALNQSRYGATVDPTANAKATPSWRVVASDGEYIWHDHRIHWMAHSLPPQLNGKDTGKVLDWNIPLLVGGQSVQIQGELFHTAAPSAFPYLALGVVAAAAAALAMRRARFVPAALLLIASLFAFFVSLVEQLSIPTGAGRRISFFVIPALAAGCALISMVRPRSIYAFVLKVATALILPLWVFLNDDTLTNARLPGDVAPIAMRVGVVAAAATVIAFAAIDLPRELRAAGARNAALARHDADDG